MKLLTIFTREYEQALGAFVSAETDAGRLSRRGEGRAEGLFFLSCAFDAKNKSGEVVEGIASLLEYVAIQENPVYRQSPALQNIALDLRGTPVHAENIKKLRAFLQQNRALHLEGYVSFRMSDYREKLDLLTYSVIRKILYAP
ncbi:MAG: hypothetical protein LBR83_01915 [Clostridiales bacterium]|jgi:hypothetical protein|nr:hypothetical protein [Clostridiales bacterium]